MSDVNRTIRQRSKGRRGSALLMALVITVILFIMGLMFVSTTQTEKSAVSGLEEQNTLETGLDAVIDQINTVLVDDLFGVGGIGMLDGPGDSYNPIVLGDEDEYWDYPGPDDPWLASLEPEYVDLGGGVGFFYWRHITDLYSDNFGIPLGVQYFDPDNKGITDQWDSTKAVSQWYWVSNFSGDILSPHKFTVARIVSDLDGMGIIKDNANLDSTIRSTFPWGARADADGDGVADSRWVKVPNITGPQGQNIYTAVRIIDNGSMINVNTAYCDPTLLGPWDGSSLTHINLEAICRSSGDDPADLHRYRCTFDLPPNPPPATPALPIVYDTEVSTRVLNPVNPSLAVPGIFYNLFDLTDELEFRNRFFINNSRLLSRAELIWPVTFVPGGGYTKNEPYVLPNEVSNWFNKACYDFLNPAGYTDIYTRRHICTAYSFDRVIRPFFDPLALPSNLQTDWGSWIAAGARGELGAPICVTDLVIAGAPSNEQIAQLAAVIYMGLPSGLETHPDFDPLKNLLGLTTIRERVACQMAVNLVDYIDTDDTVTDFNPNTGLDHYFGYEPGAHRLYICRLGVSHKDHDSDPVTPAKTYYAITLYNPSEDDAPLTNWKITAKGVNYIFDTGAPDVPAQGVLVLVSVVDPADGFLPAEGTDISSIVTGSPPPLEFADGEDVLLLNNDTTTGEWQCYDHITVDNMATGPTSLGQREVFVFVRGDKTVGVSDNYRVPAWEPTPTWEPAVVGIGVGNLGTFTPTDTTAVIQTEVRNAAMTTIGEIFNVLAIGSMNINGTYITMPECWGKFLAGGDITEETRGRIDAGTTMSIMGGDKAFNITRFVTVKGFNPFSDSVDNDGNGLSDNPGDDDEDNNNDTIIDDPAENNLAYTEYRELAVAGRININTAPWYVIAQLPWIVDPLLPPAEQVHKYKLAQAITAYRDKSTIVPNVVDYSGGRAKGMEDLTVGATITVTVREAPGFANTAELLNVTHDLAGNGPPAYDPYYDIRRFGRDGSPLGGAPDYTSDSVDDDLEERDVLFHRVSNLVTVRSDVFTAYILVRVGERGPQRRVIAIFDRSNVFSPADRPKLVALHPVPDPR